MMTPPIFGVLQIWGKRPNLCYEWLKVAFGQSVNRRLSGWRLSKERYKRRNIKKGIHRYSSRWKIGRRKYLKDWGKGASYGNIWDDVLTN